MTEPTIIAIDESIATTDSGEIYVIGSAILIDPTQRNELNQAAMDALRSGSPDRRRPFHWTDEGREIRAAMIRAVSASAAVPIAAVRPQANMSAEATRLECLRLLFRETAELGVDLILFESREKERKNIGQNRTDHQAVTEARHSKLLPPTARYEWIDKSDPIAWLADAIAGAVNLHERDDQTYTDSLDQLRILR